MRLRRIAAVTLGLAAAGSLIGGLLGAIVLSVWATVWARTDVLSAAFVGLWVGVVLGLVLGPIAAWVLLRRVPIGRALLQTAAGTAIGAFVGLALGERGLGALDNGLLGALLGFVAAAIHLRLTTRAKPAATGTTGNPAD
jgi:hypothetical protein